MREYLRMVNVSADSGEGAPLHNFYINIYEGQILFLTGVHWSGKPTLKSILLGKTAIEDGYLYLDEQPYRKKALEGHLVLCVDTASRFCSVLSIQDNLFSLQYSSGYLKGNKRKQNREKIRELLEWAEIRRQPEELVKNLNVLERSLLWLALAKQRKTRMVIFDCIGFSYSSKEYEVIGVVLDKLRAEGTAVVVLDERPNALLSLSDRAVILKRGTVAKVLYPGELNEENVLLHMTGRVANGNDKFQSDPVGEKLEIIKKSSGEELFALCRNQIIGIFDVGWGTDESMSEYLEQVFRSNAWIGSEFLKQQDTICIPESSGDCLFSSMDIGANIALTARKRLAGKLGLLRPGMLSFLRREFAGKFDIGEEVKDIDELTCRERKLLSIYRFALIRPRILMLENPMMRISLEDRPGFKAYLRELADEGSSLIVSSKEPDVLTDFCDRIFIFQDHILQEVIAGCRS